MTTSSREPHACTGRCAVGEAMSRRAFMERTALAAIAAALAACGDGQFGPLAVTNATIPDGATATFNVADFPALATVGGIATTSINGVPIAIGRTGASSYVIWSLVCPHQSQQVQVSGAGFRCPGHDATWDGNGVWTGGQNTGNLVVIPSSFDAGAGTLSINGSGPTVEQDFLVDLGAASSAPLGQVGGHISVTRPIPNSTRTTRILIARAAADEYVAYGAACGHQGKYVEYSASLGHWRCPEHDAEFDLRGRVLREATEERQVPTGPLVGLTVTREGNSLRIRGNSPPQGNP